MKLHRILPLFALAALVPGSLNAQPAKGIVLRIGSTTSMTGNSDSAQEKAGHETLKNFIKEETGLNNEIAAQDPWHEVAAKLAGGKIHLGVFQGYEFAWAQEKSPELKPLAVGINVYRYPVAIVLVKRDNAAKDFADLKGKTLAVPATAQAFLRLFVDRSCEACSLKADSFFSRVTAAENVEDALDDIVDGKGEATVIDQAAVDAYKRRKPGRFNQLKEVARSQPFPPVVVAYCGSVLDAKTLAKFKESLLNANRKDKGELLLTLSRLSSFETPADDFGRVLVETRKSYPPTK